jgi:hypothetical protein
MRSRLPALAVLAACLLLVAAVFLWFDNPTVDVAASDGDSPGPAGEVGCSIAPWDAGLNHNSGPPGGERPADYADEVGAECYSGNLLRYRAALAAGALAALCLVGGGAAWVARRRPAVFSAR